MNWKIPTSTIDFERTSSKNWTDSDQTSTKLDKFVIRIVSFSSLPRTNFSPWLKVGKKVQYAYLFCNQLVAWK